MTQQNQENEKNYPIVTDEYMNHSLKVGPKYVTLSGAEHKTIDPKTNIGRPSDECVDEMRDWSIVNIK